MGAKTSGNFWHIILGHGHCGGVGAQRIEIMITILIIIVIVIVVIIIIIIIISKRCAPTPPQCPWPSMMCSKCPDVFAASAASLCH